MTDDADRTTLLVPVFTPAPAPAAAAPSEPSSAAPRGPGAVIAGRWQLDRIEDALLTLAQPPRRSFTAPNGITDEWIQLSGLRRRWRGPGLAVSLGLLLSAAAAFGLVEATPPSFAPNASPVAAQTTIVQSPPPSQELEPLVADVADEDPDPLGLLGLRRSPVVAVPAAKPKARPAGASPRRHMDLHRQALSLLQMANPAAAATRLQEAVRLAPAYPQAHRELGRALSKLGRPDEARKSYATYLRLRPTAPDAPIYRDALASAAP